MDINVRDQMARGRRVKAFATTHMALFTGAKSVELLANVDDSIAALLDLGADQEAASGSSLAGTTGINSLVSAVREDMSLIAGTARTIELNGFDLPYDFLMPKSKAADVIISTAEAFYREASRPEITPHFLEWGIKSDFLPDLRADLDAYEGKVGDRNQSTQERKDAVSQIDVQEEKLLRAIDGLDTLMKNQLPRGAALLADWQSASRLERTRAHPKPIPPAKNSV